MCLLTTGAKRYEQLGVDAASKLLDASVDRLDATEAWLFASLNPGVGHDLEAFLLKRSTSTMPCFYWGLAESSGHADWLRKTSVADLTAKLLSGNLQLPGIEKPKKEMPRDKNPTSLPTPSLHVLKIEDLGKLYHSNFIACCVRRLG